MEEPSGKQKSAVGAALCWGDKQVSRARQG
jgi:hypothetical protein